jgi:hypothetical protein
LSRRFHGDLTAANLVADTGCAETRILLAGTQAPEVPNGSGHTLIGVFRSFVAGIPLASSSAVAVRLGDGQL